MTSSDLVQKIISCTEIEPPLSFQEMWDFIRCRMSDQDERDRIELVQKYTQILIDEEKEWWKTDYATKKETKQEIRKTNQEQKELEEKRRAFGTPILTKEWYTEEIERRVEKKKRLEARHLLLKQSESMQVKDQARLVPIDSFLEVNDAGFISCVFHKKYGEKSVTPSLRYYPKDNHVYCFSCTKRADAIDCMMAKEGLDFNNAVKRLLGT